jgi:hypothetical protein
MVNLAVSRPAVNAVVRRRQTSYQTDPNTGNLAKLNQGQNKILVFLLTPSEPVLLLRPHNPKPVEFGRFSPLLN